MPIGDALPSEHRTFTDSETGRRITQHTTAAANSYPLYYFIPSHTADSRFLLFHSERSGWVQLYRLDVDTGEIVQLTDGHTRDLGWGIWCEYHLRGIWNHLSSLNQARDEVYYFQDDAVRCTHVETPESREVARLPGRIPVGQTGFSPDGRLFAFIHVDAALYRQEMADREALENMGLWSWSRGDHLAWRNRLPTTISLIHTDTGAVQDVIRLDFYVHHVFFLDDERLLVNHPQNEAGMWSVRLDGSDVRPMRPRDAHGAANHQVVTARGVFYEANQREGGAHTVWFGRYDPKTDRHEEVRLPVAGGVHTGFDPAGRFLFLEHGGQTHELVSLHYPHDPKRSRLNTLRKLAPITGGQRRHAHPFLSPDRKRLYYTEVIGGFSQVCSFDVTDLVDRDEYWDCR